jgi:hypothetical protein
MLARGAATEVLTYHENFRTFYFGSVQDEVGVGASAVVIAPVGEEVLAETFPGCAFQETGGNDLIGIDVVDGKTYGS